MLILSTWNQPPGPTLALNDRNNTNANGGGKTDTCTSIFTSTALNSAINSPNTAGSTVLPGGGGGGGGESIDLTAEGKEDLFQVTAHL